MKLTLIFNIEPLHFGHWAPRASYGEQQGMIVCHCQRVTDRAIRAAVRQGAETEEAIAEACGAGSCCGGCVPAVTEILCEEREKRGIRLPVLITAA
jgi:bacterioferritin-associated ferredoxin